jgi:hypothetical protein
MGLRVAGRIASQRAAASRAPAGQPGTPTASPIDARQARAAQTRAAGQVAGRATRGVARGVGGFLRPFGRVGGILWLEVTGVFFFLFALVFAFAVSRTRPATLHGPWHWPFLVSIGMMLLFFYLGMSSFLRARRR